MLHIAGLFCSLRSSLPSNAGVLSVGFVCLLFAVQPQRADSSAPSEKWSLGCQTSDTTLHLIPLHSGYDCFPGVDIGPELPCR